eukprot:3523201-Prorocentrum_lima.AAC.1
MTSSLVGSEMCIRDRSYTAFSETIMAIDACLQSRKETAHWSQEGFRLTCLLYTSDAADDM